MMTPRTLWVTALAIALSVQIGMVVTYGAITDWCFCSVTGMPEPAIPPPFVMRFIELAALPAAWITNDQTLPVLLVLNLETWFFAALALLHGMAFAARLRVRPQPGEAAPHGRRIQLAGRESVRFSHMLLLGCVLIGMGTGIGALHRQRWLSQAEEVFAATMAAASADRPLPAGVRFSMYERRGNDQVRVKPVGRFAIEIDPSVAGNHFLDAFVVPYAYGGMLRFQSGKQYRFIAYPDRSDAGWNVRLDTPSRRRARW